LASREMFRLAEIEYPNNATKLRLELGPYDNGRALIKIQTAGGISDPFIHLLLNIRWSGGNILREYTALIDPAEYKVEPIAQAAAPATSLAVTKANSTQAAVDSDSELFRPVRAGDTLSAIAALYRPSDVSIQQAWMAFYNLNQDAFLDGNLNKIEKGARLKIPSDAQMRALSRTDAIRDVIKFFRNPEWSFLVMRMVIQGKRIGGFTLAAKKEDRYTLEHAHLFSLLNEPFAIAISNALRHQEILRMKDSAIDDNRYLHQELLRQSGDEIIGKDFGLKDVMQMVREVAPLNTAVLLLGETGVGKELVAKAYTLTVLVRKNRLSR